MFFTTTITCLQKRAQQHLNMLTVLTAFFVLLLFGLLSFGAKATTVNFTNTASDNSFARVLFQFSDKNGNVSANVDGSTKELIDKASDIHDFSGEFQSSISIVAPASANTQKIVVIGLGEASELGRAEANAIGGQIAQMFTHEDVQAVDVILEGLTTSIDDSLLAASIAHGINLGSYRFTKYLQSAPTPNNNYQIVSNAFQEASDQYLSFRAIENGVFLARDLVNQNARDITPVTFIEAATEALEGLNVDIKVFDNKQIADMNMGLLHAVGQGSQTGSRLMIVHYKGGNDKAIALVGKGITFDTGGYNIKTHESIALMKGDMAGAAAVLGTVKALAEQNAKVNVIAAMPLAENMVSETALVPGDIITSMSGKSVEIKNTDAEGRLIMADAMWHVQKEYEPQIMINIATLTGSKIRAVGDRYAALFSDDDELLQGLQNAGELVNEPLWHLPLAYGDMLKSTHADTSNIGSGGPGASTAAMFLKLFVEEDTRWAHLDIAGSELTTTTKNEVPAGGVGYGVRLLTQWLTEIE